MSVSKIFSGIFDLKGSIVSCDVLVVGRIILQLDLCNYLIRTSFSFKKYSGSRVVFMEADLLLNDSIYFTFHSINTG